jgi:hypothetical protein
MQNQYVVFTQTYFSKVFSLGDKKNELKLQRRQRRNY